MPRKPITKYNPNQGSDTGALRKGYEEILRTLDRIYVHTGGTHDGFVHAMALWVRLHASGVIPKGCPRARSLNHAEEVARGGGPSHGERYPYVLLDTDKGLVHGLMGVDHVMIRLERLRRLSLEEFQQFVEHVTHA